MIKSEELEPPPANTSLSANDQFQVNASRISEERIVRQRKSTSISESYTECSMAHIRLHERLSKQKVKNMMKNSTSKLGIPPQSQNVESGSTTNASIPTGKKKRSRAVDPIKLYTTPLQLTSYAAKAPPVLSAREKEQQRLEEEFMLNPASKSLKPLNRPPPPLGPSDIPDIKVR